MDINKTHLKSRKINSDDECNCFPPWHINAEKAPAIGGNHRLDWPWSRADWRGFTWYVGSLSIGGRASQGHSVPLVWGVHGQLELRGS